MMERGPNDREAGRATIARRLAVLMLLVAAPTAPVAPRPPREALVVVAPHPDDESILAADTIHELALDRRRLVWAIYMSGGDAAGLPGPCNGLSDEQRRRRSVRLREHETRRAWRVLAPGRHVPIRFLRGPDQGLVASSTLAGGLREDTLSEAGARAVARAVARIARLPRAVERVVLVTAARFDAHGDHRAAHRAASIAAERLGARGVDVTLWSFIVHDEATVEFPTCCIGDLHWPGAGPTHDWTLLVDTPARPRPPLWDVTHPVASPTIRRDTLARHVSQVMGDPRLCMPVLLPSFYANWIEKTEEPFYEERWTGSAERGIVDQGRVTPPSREAVRRRRKRTAGRGIARAVVRR